MNEPAPESEMTQWRHVASRIWCETEHSHREMDVDLAESIAKDLAAAHAQGMEAAAKHLEDMATNYDGPEQYRLHQLATSIRARIKDQGNG